MMMNKAFWSSARRKDALWLILVFGLSVCISWQGWKAIFPTDDAVPNIQSAINLVQESIIPSRGVVSSYSSVIPPGTVWLYLPGILSFSDFRLFELWGSLLLHAGTLIGLLILVRLAFSRSAARIAVALYAFSPIGIFFASSLWPRGHPFFVVWFVIWTILWYGKRDARYLAAALVTLAAGMYVFMELAPLALVPLAVYYLYRPPLGMNWILVGASCSLLIWLPYLHFEQKRGFRDIASVVFQRDIAPPDSARALCAIDLRDEVLKQQATAERSTITRVRGFLRSRPRAALTGLITNFRPYRVSFGRPWEVLPDSAIGKLPLVAASAALIAAFAGVLIFIRSRPAGSAVPAAFSNPLVPHAETIVFLALGLPWAVLLLLAEGEARRYLFLWPLQIALLAYFATDRLARLTAHASVLKVAQVVLVGIFVMNPTVLAKVKDWRTNGWAGADSDVLRSLGFVAALPRADRNQAAVGYSTPGGGDDLYQAVDPRYKIGLEMDYVLSQRFGIRNLERCPEGISTVDDYLIVQLGPDLDAPGYVRLRQRVLAQFEQVARFGGYAVYARPHPRSGPF
jgi:hypothetical protein